MIGMPRLHPSSTSNAWTGTWKFSHLVIADRDRDNDNNENENTHNGEHEDRDEDKDEDEKGSMNKDKGDLKDDIEQESAAIARILR